MIKTNYKFPSETRLYSFEFATQAEVVAGETLVSGAAVSKTQIQGDTDTLTLGTPAILGTAVRVEISGGAVGDEHELLCTVTTSSGAIISCVGRLAIRKVN